MKLSNWIKKLLICLSILVISCLGNGGDSDNGGSDNSSTNSSPEITDTRVAKVTLTVTDNFQRADSNSFIILTIVARDNTNAPLTDVPVSLASSSDSVVFLETNGNTEANGRFTTGAVSSLPGTFEVVATAGGVRSEPTQVTFIAPVGGIELIATETVLPVDGKAKITVTVHREFASNIGQTGDPLPDAPVNAVASSKTATISGVPTNTDANGQITFSVTDSVAEEVTVTVISGPASQTVILYFGSQLNLLPVTTNAIGTATLKALLKNGNNSPLPEQVITFNFVGNNNETLSPAQAITDTDGTAEVTVTDLSNDGGVAIINAHSGQLTAQATVNFLASLGQGRNLAVTPSATVLAIDQVATLTTTIKDSVGIPIIGQSVNFSVALANGNPSNARIVEIAPANSVTDAKGEVRVLISDSVGENVNVTVQVGTTTQKVPLYFGATIALVPAESEGHADGTTTASLTASVNDATKAGIAGTLVNFRVQTGSALLDTFQVATDATGRAIVKVVNPAKEKTVVEAQVDNLITKATINFEALNNPYSITLSTNPADPITLPLNGTATITALVKDDRGIPVKDGVRIHFAIKSPSEGTTSQPKIGSITEAGFTRDGGKVTAIFNAGTTAGLTIVNVTSDVPYSTDPLYIANAAVSITVQPASAGIIEIDSINPPVIGIIGSGVTQSTTIRFSVKDALGNPVADNTLVNFSLGDTVLGGGEVITTGDSAGSTNATGKTSNGLVAVTLKSGSVAGNIDVIASVGNVSTVARVTLVGNVPDADHLALALQYLNIAGGIRFGLQDAVTAYVGDRFGNIVPDGTSVSFITEGGTIGKSIGGGAFTTTTQFGQATAILQSAGPTTPELGGVATLQSDGYSCSFPYAFVVLNTQDNLCSNPGWVTVVTYTTGSESFIDVNGNGVFDSNIDRHSHPGFKDTNGNGIWDMSEIITEKGDMSEPFIDGNDNGTFDPGELYIDVNNNRQFDGPDGRFQSNTTIWKSARVLFSAETARPIVEPSTFTIHNGGGQSFTVTNIQDIYGNALVGGTHFQVTTNDGILGGTTDTML
ncbi:MAG: hypothetical protein BWK79_08145, partial [Beggiatoa sp. IS2]